MSDITFLEKGSFESLFGMGSGYVLDFSDRTFQEYIDETTGINIYDKKYDHRSGSKANRIRGLWKVESNYLVGKVMGSLLEYWIAKARTGKYDFYSEELTFKSCQQIVERLLQDAPIAQIDTFNLQREEKDFNLLAKSIRESIEKNEPEVALDRLHTYVIKFVRQLCEQHSISFGKDDPLHSLFGKYVKFLSAENRLESLMTERILKAAISILDAFNDIRNNKSLAHDNPLLNYQESILIFNSVTSTIKFIESIEASFQKTQDTPPIEEFELPF
jgi:hypothetical protein